MSYCIAYDTLAEFLRERRGRIVNLLSTYDPEVAKRVYAEEQVEEERIKIAKGLLLEGDSIEKIIRLTKVPLETIRELQQKFM